MTPPPPPPPPGPGATASIAPTSPNGPAAAAAGAPKVISNGGAPAIADHNDQLMAAIRNGISLKPAKTNDRSTPAFIKQANGVLDDNDDTTSSVSYDKSTSIDEMKDALQAELRNTLKRKIKKQDLEEGDGRKNEEIERSIEHTRNEVQLKLNGSSPTPNTPKVENPLKTIVDIVDKERGVVVAATKQASPVMTQKKPASVPSTPTVQPIFNGTSTLRKVSAGQYPNQNGTTTVIQINPSTRNNTTPVVPTAITKTSVPLNASPVLGTNTTKATNGAVGLKSPTSVQVGKVISNGSSTIPKGSTLASSVPSKVNASQTVSSAKAMPERTNTVSASTVKVANGSLPSGGVVSNANGTAFKNNSFQSKLPPTSPANDSNKTKGGISYSNTLPRANGISSTKALSNTSTGAIPATYTSSVKVTIGSFGDSVRSTSNTAASPVSRNGTHTKFEPLTIDTSSNGGSTNGTSSPTTPKELLSPQVRSGAASIRPSQIRTLTKSGSVVSHTDILETSKPVTKLPVTLVEPAPVLTAAAAVSPPPKASVNTAPLPTPPAKERTPLFEKANKDAPKSPMNRWAESGSISGGTARKLLLTHGRPNFTIKRSNSRQGFDVDEPDMKGEYVKPVFRILTDLEKMEQQDDNSRRQQQQQQASQVVASQPQQTYVSFAKDLSNAPNNHPDLVAVTKPSTSSNVPSDPFLANLKDIKIDISEMKIVNAKNA
ncbi:mucin-12-like [Anopheles marshallii]|uniref:mucin-12-like n=1 Tax=Anopheles marshallii TaxID=1521116 RepID=UPI00237B4113|nr:mucin-12-like [Anopheles marshallii]